jgi:DNA replication licensing factor MCM4
MRNLNPADIDQLVSLRGMITRCSSIIPDLKMGFFRCTMCHASVEVDLDRGRIMEPSVCDHCNTRNSMELLHNRCAFTDKQMVRPCIYILPQEMLDIDSKYTQCHATK